MGTHPIFESDFDCLTECKMELPGYYYDAVKKRYFKGSRPTQPLTINDKAPLSSCNAPESLSVYLRQRRIRPDRLDPLSRFTQIKSEINIPAHVKPLKHISFSPCGNLSICLTTDSRVRILPLSDFRESAVDPTRPLNAYDGVRGVAEIYSALFALAPGLHGGCTVATAVTHMPSAASSGTYTLLDLCRLDDDGLECPINLSFAEFGKTNDLKFLNEGKLVYTTGRCTFLLDKLDTPFYASKHVRDNHKLLGSRSNSSVICSTNPHSANHGAGKLVAEGFQDGFIRLWDATTNEKFFHHTIAMPKECRPSSIHVDGFNLTAAYFGPNSKLCTYDIRGNTIIPVLEGPVRY